MKISGYENIDIEGYKTSLTVVKSDNGLYYLWFENLEDINYFKTTGYVIKATDVNSEILPVNQNGIIPQDINGIVKQLINPTWTKEN